MNNLCLTIAFIDNNCVRYTIPCDNGVCWEERCDDNGDKCGDNSDKDNCNTEGSYDCPITVYMWLSFKGTKNLKPDGVFFIR